MELKKFIEKFAEAIESENPNLLTPDTKFREINEWSSLSALNIIAMVDEEYEVELTGNDVRNAKTIEEIFEVIKGKV